MELLKELFYGNISPNHKKVRSGSKLEHLQNLITQNDNRLMATLTDEQKELFEKYKDCTDESTSLIELEAFMEGFRLGARLMLEITDDSKFDLEEYGIIEG